MRYDIRNLQASEIQTAVDWAADEGWNPGCRDAEAPSQRKQLTTTTTAARVERLGHLMIMAEWDVADAVLVPLLAGREIMCRQGLELNSDDDDKVYLDERQLQQD